MPTDAPADTAAGGGSVQRAVLAVTVETTVEDTALARILGWTTVVPGATVVLVRANSALRYQAVSDANGALSFTGLLPGSYTVSVLRSLTSAERATLAGAQFEVDALGGAAVVTVTAPSTTASVSARAGARGSMVFSEIWFLAWGWSPRTRSVPLTMVLDQEGRILVAHIGVVAGDSLVESIIKAARSAIRPEPRSATVAAEQL